MTAVGTFITLNDTVNIVTYPFELVIKLVSFANIIQTSLSCAHYKRCMLAFWLLMLDPFLNAFHLRNKASHSGRSPGQLLAESV